MTPLMFGPPARRLFGIHHPSESATTDRGAVLICPPFGQEALRSHRFFRVLADRLARAGFSVLRFDYYGTGDSPGDDADGDFEGWRRDVLAAHDELRRLSGSPSRSIGWLGVRLGGTLAIQAAQSSRLALERIVLWEPVVDGRRYAQHLREWHVESLELSYCIPESSLRRRLADDPHAFTDEASGFAVSPLLRQQFSSLQPQSLRIPTDCRTLVLGQRHDEPLRQWVQMQVSEPPPQFFEFEHPLIWNSDPSSNNAMVPAEALKRLLAAMYE
ncbi:MAG: alpha/beta fold hydrolase [Variovorax sp.]|jgi:exosortase A-associated hydrolase 2|nr:MAG: alpha/beta fold hydrolase [Variovorax sp.]